MSVILGDVEGALLRHKWSTLLLLIVASQLGLETYAALIPTGEHFETEYVLEQVLSSLIFPIQLL